MPKRNIPHHLKKWIEARRRFGLSNAHIQMARELGLNPRKFGGLANHKQEPWKVPLPQFIENLYDKRFGKQRPDRVISIEETADRLAEKESRPPRASPEEGGRAAARRVAFGRFASGRVASGQAAARPESSALLGFISIGAGLLKQITHKDAS